MKSNFILILALCVIFGCGGTDSKKSQSSAVPLTPEQALTAIQDSAVTGDASNITSDMLITAGVVGVESSKIESYKHAISVEGKIDNLTALNIIIDNVNSGIGSIYITGYLTIDGVTKNNGYFKNGSFYSIPNLEQVSSMWISGRDVYLAGWPWLSTKAYYYKNTIFNDLSTNFTGGSVARMIQVVNDDVYIAIEYDLILFTNNKLGFFKNNTFTNITDGSKYRLFDAMFFTPTNGYIAYVEFTDVSGDRLVDNYLFTLPDNTKTLLYSGTSLTNFMFIYSLIVNNNNIYLLEEIYESFFKVISFLYKKNSDVIYLTDGSNNVGGGSMSVENNNVYIAGRSDNTISSRAIYWKNGTITYLTPSYDESSANIIKVINGNVYIAGSRSLNPIFWKNGVEYKYFEGTVTGSIDHFFVTATP